MHKKSGMQWKGRQFRVHIGFSFREILEINIHPYSGVVRNVVLLSAAPVSTGTDSIIDIFCRTSCHRNGNRFIKRCWPVSAHIVGRWVNCAYLKPTRTVVVDLCQKTTRGFFSDKVYCLLFFVTP